MIAGKAAFCFVLLWFLIQFYTACTVLTFIFCVKDLFMQQHRAEKLSVSLAPFVTVSLSLELSFWMWHT